MNQKSKVQSFLHITQSTSNVKLTQKETLIYDITKTTYDEVLSFPYMPFDDPMSRTVYSIMRQFLLHPDILRSSSRLSDPIVTFQASMANV